MTTVVASKGTSKKRKISHSNLKAEKTTPSKREKQSSPLQTIVNEDDASRVTVEKSVSEAKGDVVVELPSLKDFASSDPSLRRQNLTTILTFLTDLDTETVLTHDQSMQLWRAFSVALYMHDSKSTLSVQNLITTLSTTFDTLSHRFADTSDTARQSRQLSIYADAFWSTIVREWSSIDSHRMNKYLLLIRFVTRRIFALVISAADNTALLESQAQILERFPLAPRERKVSDGLRLHVLSVYVDELFEASKIAGAEEVVSKQSRKKLMVPVQRIAKEALAKHVRVAARDVVKDFEEREGNGDGEVDDL